MILQIALLVRLDITIPMHVWNEFVVIQLHVWSNSNTENLSTLFNLIEQSHCYLVCVLYLTGSLQLHHWHGQSLLLEELLSCWLYLTTMLNLFTIYCINWPESQSVLIDKCCMWAGCCLCLSTIITHNINKNFSNYVICIYLYDYQCWQLKVVGNIPWNHHQRLKDLTASHLDYFREHAYEKNWSSFTF